jgi:cytochrome c oxidase assembly protein subunit 15
MLIIKKFNKQIHVWLISLILLVGSIIIVGGLTRLTNSGLSIIEWELFTGIFPPKTFEEWIIYFKLYQSIPQFEYVNSMMTLDEFKVIFLWEYSHRLLARFIGLFFIIPFLFFLYKKILSNEYRYKLSIIFILILLQGIVGWYMVKSGLVYNISVSHYRLSMHLFIAFIIFSSLLWMYLNFSRKKNKKFFLNHTKVSSLKLLIFLIYIQIIMGAFVSGLDAGKIYQTWPLMNNSFFPDDVVILNFKDIFNFNNHSLVQFFHRNLAYLIFLLSIYVGFKIFQKKIKYLYKSYRLLMVIIFLQITLGILTLILNLRIEIASLHQISSIFLIYFSLNLYHRSIINNV